MFNARALRVLYTAGKTESNHVLFPPDIIKCCTVPETALLVVRILVVSSTEPYSVCVCACSWDFVTQHTDLRVL